MKMSELRALLKDAHDDDEVILSFGSIIPAYRPIGDALLGMYDPESKKFSPDLMPADGVHCVCLFADV